MAIAIFFVLTLISAAVIAYPLMPGRAAAQPAPAVTDGDIEQAVRRLRRSQSQSGPACPSCGRAYQPGDRFCVGCGAALPAVAPAERLCPSCGASLREDDRFCPKCGHDTMGAEAA